MQLIPHDPTEAPALEQFATGVARPRVVVGPDETSELRVLSVSFEPGGHNHPHTHTFDQVLYTLEGTGFVATETERLVVGVGDIVVIPAGERHWHGATDDGSLRQLAIGVPGQSDFDGQAFGATE
jgi:quercetin dioxygenase-like cupin family protein